MAEGKVTHMFRREFFALLLRGGGSDLACDECLPMARKERDDEGVLLDVARTDPGGERCVWCGWEDE